MRVIDTRNFGEKTRCSHCGNKHDHLIDLGLLPDMTFGYTQIRLCEDCIDVAKRLIQVKEEPGEWR